MSIFVGFDTDFLKIRGGILKKILQWDIPGCIPLWPSMFYGRKIWQFFKIFFFDENNVFLPIFSKIYLKINIFSRI